MAKIDAELVAVSLPTQPARAGLPRRPVWAIPPGAEPDTATFALAAAAALGVG